MKEKGLIHIYYGDGKGKTTAAMGQVVRAAGNGLKVLVYQFMKDNTSGERMILEQIRNITCLQGVKETKFSFQMNEQEKEAQCVFCTEMLAEIEKHADEYDVILLDEIICAVRVGFLKEQDVTSFLEHKPFHTEVILTGNTPCKEMILLADYVTEMKKIKHPYDLGICARDGIER